MPIHGNQRIAKGPHPFWLATCGIDTHKYGSKSARNHTPWAAFTADGGGLVCTVWRHEIAEVRDPQVGGALRRFVVLGGFSGKHKGGAVARERDTQQHLEKARSEQLPVFGFEVLAKTIKGSDKSGGIKHVYMDRVHLLRPHFGLRGDELKARLNLMEMLREACDPTHHAGLQNGMLFELVAAPEEFPGRSWLPDGDGRVGEGGDEDRAGTAAYWANLALPILVDHVRRQTDDVLVPLTYEQLAERLGRVNRHGNAWARGIGHALGEVTLLIEAAAESWDERDKPPYLTTIVVSKSGKDAGLPDVGIQHRWPSFSELSSADKRAKVGEEYRRILAYGERWLDVLESAGLQLPYEEGSDVGGGHVDGHGGWGGGESEEHRALKAHVLAHPEFFDVKEGAGYFAVPEHALLSADVIDAFFGGDSAWTGVEVKSIRSADDDLERGIYQVVKYRAVLEAQALVQAPESPPRVAVFLAVQRPLPKPLQEVAVRLNVRWREVRL